MAFTTWTALYAEMLNDLQSKSWRIKSYAIGGRSISYNSFDEFRAALEYARVKAAEEGGTHYPRTYGKPASGGKW
jgi:hypothetical protein